MKKTFVSLAAFAAVATLAAADESEMQAQIDALTKKVQQLEKVQKRTNKKLSEVNQQSAHDNIKWDVDFRTSYDYLEYKTAGGNKLINNALYSNRLWLGMGFAPRDDMFFKGQLSVNKAFGADMNGRGTGFDNMDWFVNENLTDDTVKLREAYWLWSPSIGDVGLTFSVGRRPATYGYLINLRDDTPQRSPLGHIINMEFDGASASAKFDEYVSGMYFKLCVGRGLTNALPPFNTANLPNYVPSTASVENVDLAGFIFQPYNDGQYSVMTSVYRGFNVPGYQLPATSMQTVGDMDGAALSGKIEGVGDEISDFLDETILFASLGWTKSHPKAGMTMLGESEGKSGTSYWFGAQTPNLTGGRFGVEFNHGSRYWRPFTYGEDTMVGSKMAVRGNAYEAYWTQPLVGKILSMQVRYTYLVYDYTGSNGFFGDTGAAMSMSDAQAAGMDPVESAKDLRVYLRYRY